MATSTSLTLYNLEENLVALLDTQEVVEDEQQHLEILREIADASQAAVAKRDNVIRMHRHLSLQQDAIDAEIKRLQALKANYIHAQDRLEHYVIRIIDDLVPAPKRGSKKLEGSIGVLYLRKNPGAVEIADEAAVPTKYKDITITMDADEWLRWAPDPLVAHTRKAEYRVKKAEVKKALKSDEDVPGADLGFDSLRLEVK